jgi:pilus assembly protein CpaE
LPDTRVLLLGDSKSDPVARILALHDRVVTQVEDADEAIKLAPDHAIVVIDAVSAPRTIASVCRDIRAVPELAEIPVLAISASDDVEDRIRLLEAGADDVMARPVDERELDARIEALDLRSRRSKQLRPGTVVSSTRRLDRRLIVVFSPKGGAGTTTVAVNLALAIAARDIGEVAVIDLVEGTGSVATYLNAHPRLTITDMARDTLAVGDPAAARTYLTSADKITILAGRPGPGSPDVVDRENVGQIIETVLSAVPTVVVDAGSNLDDRTIAAMELADNVVLVVTPEFPGLQSVHLVLEYLREIGSSIGDTTVVLNEIFEKQMLTPADIEGALGRPVAARIPHDPQLFQRAANEGSPIYLSAHGSPQAKRFEVLAGVVLGEDVAGGATEPRRRRLGTLFGRS